MSRRYQSHMMCGPYSWSSGSPHALGATIGTIIAVTSTATFATETRARRTGFSAVRQPTLRRAINLTRGGMDVKPGFDVPMGCRHERVHGTLKH